MPLVAIAISVVFANAVRSGCTPASLPPSCSTAITSAVANCGSRAAAVTLIAPRTRTSAPIACWYAATRSIRPTTPIVLEPIFHLRLPRTVAVGVRRLRARGDVRKPDRERAALAERAPERDGPAEQLG